MRKIRIIEHISLDGVIQATGGPNEDPPYPHEGWATRPLYHIMPEHFGGQARHLSFPEERDWWSPACLDFRFASQTRATP
jgi:hypothetical protein